MKITFSSDYTELTPFKDSNFLIYITDPRKVGFGFKYRRVVNHEWEFTFYRWSTIHFKRRPFGFITKNSAPKID